MKHDEAIKHVQLVLAALDEDVRGYEHVQAEALRMTLARLELAEKIVEATQAWASTNKVPAPLALLLNEWDDLVVRQEK